MGLPVKTIGDCLKKSGSVACSLDLVPKYGAYSLSVKVDLADVSLFVLPGGHGRKRDDDQEQTAVHYDFQVRELIRFVPGHDEHLRGETHPVIREERARCLLYLLRYSQSLCRG
jgi:hypothetical protein